MTKTILIRKMLQLGNINNTYSIVVDFSFYENGARCFASDLNYILTTLEIKNVVEFLIKLYEIVDALPIGGEVLYVHKGAN